MATLEIALTDFCRYLAAERGLSRHTLEAYRRDISSFIVAVAASGKTEPSTIALDDIVSYIGVFRSKGYASATVARALIAIKVFFRFMKREGYTTVNVALGLNSPKVWQLIPDILSMAEVEALIHAATPLTTRGARDRAILEVLYGCGLRVSELCLLNLYDVSDEGIHVRGGKGGKERLVPIGEPALHAIDHYLSHGRGECLDERAPLFVSKGGTRMDRIAVWKLVKRYGARAGITKIISPHTLRHAFATHLLDNGADLRVIQEMMGHSHIVSTGNYMHLSRRHIQDAFRSCHPRDI